MDSDSFLAPNAGPVSTHQSSDNSPIAADVIAPQSTYRRFVASVFDHLQHLLPDTVQPEAQGSDAQSDARLGINSGGNGGRERSPSSPTFPGAYPCDPHPPTRAAAAEIPGRNMHRPHVVSVPPAELRPPDTNQNFFQNASGFTISGNARFVNIVNNTVGTAGLGALKEYVSFSALHDSSEQDPERRCHPGTRESILRQICHWVDDPNTTDRILWLHGPAGVGKSAIAQTVARSFGQDKVAATFFFFRSDPSRNDGNRLFPTLAWQLAKSIPGAGDCLAHALDRDSDIPRKAIEIQFEHLIARPLLRITEASPEAQTLSQVVIIDGVDECVDEKLQSRFLEAIGNSVTHSRLSLRFLISSRPEADIQDAFSEFEAATLSIDLAEVDDSHRDIEIYFIAEFARIAKEHRLDPLTWPGESIIQEFVLKSSGQFVYASTIIKFIGDKYNSADSQLRILLGLKPNKGRSPFAELDALYIEILKRQPDQEFLKEFLTLFVGRTAFETRDDLGQADPMLLNVDNNEFHRKLRGMHSLVVLEPYITVHHRSFLDFLQQQSRSGPYHVSEHTGRRRYLELVTQLVVQYASKIIKQPDSYEADRFVHFLCSVVSRHVAMIELPLLEWEEVLLPLWGVKGELLKMRRCHELNQCIFDVVDSMLLHHQFLRGTSQETLPSLSSQVAATDLPFFLPRDMVQKVTGGSSDGLQQQEFTDICNATQRGEQAMSEEDVADCFFSLIRNLLNTELELSASVTATDRLRACFSLDPVEVASTVQSISDGQNLVDLLFYLAKNIQLLDHYPQALTRNMMQLALELWRRTKLLPRSIFLKQPRVSFSRYSHDDLIVRRSYIKYKDLISLYGSLYTWAFLSHTTIFPFLGVYHFDSKGPPDVLFAGLRDKHCMTLQGWRYRSNPPVALIQQRMLELAHAILVLYSLGVSCDIRGYSVHLDSNSHIKLNGEDFSLLHYNDIPEHKQDDVLRFGRAFYEVLYDPDPPNNHILMNCDLTQKDPETYTKRPLEPEIPDYTWELIQRCCVTEPAYRPTIDEIVEEMEFWK